jgi:MSHA biogenesis protein MshM
LHTPPFSSRADSGFFYADAERTQYLDMLQHLTQYSEELLLVVGDAGIGKSTLLNKYLERSEEHWRLCRLTGEQGVDLDALFHRVAECFAVELGKVEPSQLLGALRQHLDALLDQQLSVLVIDDAHALSDDALEMVFHLSALEGEHGKLIRVLLFADSAIDVRLASERFVQLTTPHRLQLKPLAEADSSAYLLHRLQQAGYSGVSPFNVSELNHLHRQARGVPAQLNQAAHALLLERTKGAATAPGLARQGLRMGVAATALIGTVLGMHEHINALLGGSANNSMAVTAERPVLRLADRDNPWAVVIRDGESIQISCGAPQAQTVAVRPIPASTPLESQTMIATPMIHPVSAPQEAVAEPALSIATAEPLVVAEAPVDISVTAAVEPPEIPAQEEPPATPLVIKAPIDITPELPAGMVSDAVEPTAVAPEPVVAPEPAVPEKLLLERVYPDPVIGSDQPQTITLIGSALEPDSKVAVSWSGKVKALEASQVVVRDSGHMELTLTTGVEAGIWAVQVSSPSKQRSNVLRFQIEAPRPVIVTNESKGALKSESQVEVPSTAQPIPPAKQPEPPTVPVETKPETKKLTSTKPVAPKSATSKPVSKKPATDKARAVQADSWVAAQPDSNYTLQLLAASEANALDGLLAEYPEIAGPFGRFEQQSDGKRLYVLTQGSYPERNQAEVAAGALPGKLQPWIRDFAGIKKVMTTPISSTVTTPVTSESGGIKDTAWVWSQSPAEFTIQLAGASDEASIEAEMARLALPGELAVVQGQRNGQPWYSLVYGRFATKDAAQGTVSRLPAVLKKAGPWIRQFSALQSEIGQATSR